MKRIALYLHGSRPEAVATAKVVIDAAAERGVGVMASADDAARIADSRVEVGPPFVDVDLVIVLGGDGTLLRAVDDQHLRGIAFLGVNIGRLGFLSGLERPDLEAGLRRVLDDGFEVQERVVLEVEVEQSSGKTQLRALNDIIVGKAIIGRAIRVAVAVDDEQVVSWAADGVVVASATGSTAYSFSAGGPIVSPRLDCLLVTPVAPHGLMDRSLVVPADEEVRLTVEPDPDSAALSADGGPGLPLSSGALVRVRASRERVRLARLDPVPFWALVRDKFRLDSER